MATAICHTADCGNADVPIEVDMYVELDGERFPVSGVVCGACGQPITDISDEEATP